MNNPYSFVVKNLKLGFKINLDGYNFNHANSTLTIIPVYPDFGIGTKYIYKIMKEMANIYVRLMNL